LDSVIIDVDGIDKFELSRKPTKNGEEHGLVEALDALVMSRERSRNLFHRAVAAEIALEIGYRAEQLQMHHDGAHTQEVIMWESEGEDYLRPLLESHEYLDVVDETEDSGDIIYTMECDFDKYYTASLLD
jgi:hypothetical protein